MGEALDIGGLKGVTLDALSLQTMQYGYGGLRAIDDPGSTLDHGR